MVEQEKLYSEKGNRAERPLQTVRMCIICHTLTVAPLKTQDHEVWACDRCMDRR